MPFDVTGDAEGRARLTLNVSPTSTGCNWSASVTDNNGSFSGFGAVGAGWTVIVANTTVATASNRSYDFGNGNIASPYFPRSASGSLNLSPGTYTARASFTGAGVVGSASIPSFEFTVVQATTTFTAVYSGNLSTSGSTSSTSYVSPTSSSGTIASNGFTRTGYTFTGWNTASNGTGTSYSPGGSFTGNLNLFAQWAPNSFTINYSPNNGTGTTNSTSWTYPTTSGTVSSNGFLRSGFNFNSWNTNQNGSGTSYSPGSTYNGGSLDSGSNSVTLYAQWQTAAIIPSFTDSSVSSPVTMGTPYSDGVAATNASSYSIVSGSLPTGLSFNTSSGTITGTPTAQGSFTFSIRATSSTSNTADTGSLTINVLPPGTRPSTSTRLNTAKRFDGSAWVNLTTMKRFNGTSWVNITNT